MHLNRKSIVILLACFFVLILAGGLFYYFKYYKTGADTVSRQPRNTSCVIKVVDEDTNKPVVNAVVTYLALPQIKSVYSKTNGCVALPEDLAAINGDFYEVNVDHLNYELAQEYIKISNNVLIGKTIQTIKIKKASDTTKTGPNPSAIPKEKNTTGSFFNIQQAQAADNPKETVKLWVNVVDALNSNALVGAEIVLWEINKYSSELSLASCQTELSPVDTGYCMISIPNITYDTLLDIDNSEIKYKITITQNDYRPATLNLNSSTLEIYSGEGNETLVSVYVKLDPSLEEKSIGKFTGKSLSGDCNAPIEINVTWLARKQDLEKKLWDQQTIQNTVDNLVTSICSLQKSLPVMSEIPIPKIKILQYMDVKYAAAYVRQGEPVIFIGNKQLCGNLDNAATEKCRANTSWLFSLSIHEYGHVLDLIGSLPRDVLGRFSGQQNLINLFKLVNANDVADGYTTNLFANCPKTAKLGDSYNGPIRCYYTMNEKEFWAESFTSWMGQSLSADLKLNPETIKANTIPYSSSSNTNVLSFWKKFMATTHGSYCHPSIMDDNGFKQDGTLVDTAIATGGNIIKGGPIAPGVTYSADQILKGEPLIGSGLSVTFKKLPDNSTPSGMTDEGFSVVPYATGANDISKILLAKYPTTKGAWPDTLIADGKRCGVYRNGTLSETDTNDNIKKADVTKGPFPLFSMTKYELRGYYRCNKTEVFKEISLKGPTELNTKTKDQSIDIDLTKYVSCPSSGTTPTAPPGMPK